MARIKRTRTKVTIKPKPQYRRPAAPSPKKISAPNGICPYCGHPL